MNKKVKNPKIAKDRKKYRKRVMIGGALGVVSLATTGIANAHLGNNPETRQAVKAAFEAKNYNAFMEAAKDTKIIEKIDTQEKFDKVIEAHVLREAGDLEGAKAIKQELGLDGHGHRGKKNPAAKAAIEANDYTAFREAINGGKFSEKIDSAEKFTKLVEVNELRAQGKHEEAKVIMKELGFEKSGHGKKGHHRTHTRGTTQSE